MTGLRTSSLFLLVLIMAAAPLVAGCGGDEPGDSDGARGSGDAVAEQQAYIDGFTEDYGTSFLGTLFQDQADAICEEAGPDTPNCPSTVTDEDVVSDPGYVAFRECTSREAKDVDPAPKEDWQGQAKAVAEACEPELVSGFGT